MSGMSSKQEYNKLCMHTSWRSSELTKQTASHHWSIHLCNRIKASGAAWREAIWLMRLLLDLGYHHKGVLIIQRDNMAALALLRDRRLKSLSNQIDNISAFFFAELSAITEKNRKSAEFFGYLKSPSKIGSASLTTESVMSRPTCRFAKRQFSKSPGTVSVCYVSI